MRFNFGISFTIRASANVAQLMIPRFFGIGIGQINFFVDTYFVFGKGMPQGSLAALSVAPRHGNLFWAATPSGSNSHPAMMSTRRANDLSR